MNAIQQDYGLSARQQTIHPANAASTRYSHPIRILQFVTLTIVALVSLSCKQDSQAQNTASVERSAQVRSDSANKPKENIRVNRTYDDKGNLVGFDSTYSSYYSNLRGDTSAMDSLMKRFDKFFDTNHSSVFDQQFNTLFFNDSLRYPDFFHKDFFMKRYELNDPYLRYMMQRMDSIKNRFYEKQKYPASKNKT